jgi:hypothetical protein
MNPMVKTVKPIDNYMLHIGFVNGEEKLFDVKPYLDRGIFSELKDLKMFNTVQPDGLSIEWANEASLSPDTLYIGSVNI